MLSAHRVTESANALLRDLWITAPRRTALDVVTELELTMCAQRRALLDLQR
jgi:hypothetical protein